MKKRDDETMFNLILQIAKNNENVRAVILNGSRANSNAPKDEFQDYDIVYIVNEVEPFVENREWLNSFGELLIMQTPDEIDGIWPQNKDRFAFLMQFKDGNRIDLTLMQQERFQKNPRDSQSILLLDKDSILGKFEDPNNQDYLPKKPTKKEFMGCCNEFFWVSLYVAKGIARKQLSYAKSSKHLINEQLIKLLIWDAAIKTNFQINIGTFGKYLQKYLEPETWNKFCKTYVDADYDNMWNSLFIMCELFDEIALKISKHFNYSYNHNEYHEVIKYLKEMKGNL